MTTPEKVDSTLPVPEGYTLVRRLGAGTFGEVWEALAPGKVRTALKFIYRSLDSEEAQRERKSLEILKELEHDHLLEVRAFWQNEDRLVIAMPLAAGGSLRERLKAYQQEGRPGIPIEELIGYMHDTADALDYLHQRDILHRDIKPDNILLRGKSAKLADFGLLRDDSTQQSMVGPVGTPPYMAPEIWRYRATKESDQYALACTYAELRRGQRPFPQKTRENLMVAHTEGQPELSRLPDEEQKVLLRALAKDPAKRFPSCTDFVRALESAQAATSNNIPLLPFQTDQSGPRTEIPMGTEPGGSARSILPGERTLTRLPEAGAEPTKSPASSTKNAMVRPGDRTTDRRSRSQVVRPKRLVAPKPRRRKGWFLVLALLACLAGVGGVVGYRLWPRGDALARVTVPLDPPWVHLGPGQSTEVALQVERAGFEGPVELSFDVREGVRVTGGPVPEGADEVKVKVEADASARPGPYSITVTTRPGSDVKAEFDVHVLPAGFVPADGAKPEGDGTHYFRRIVRRVGGQEVVFALVRPHGGTPFYLMENKVWNALFRAFTEEEKSAAGPEWQKGGLAAGKDVVPLNDQHPVFRITRAEAERFAKWLGGRLPDPAELEQAMAGPVGRRAAVGRYDLGPRPVNDPENEDVSRAGVRDLSGNGREWTRGELRAGDEDMAVLAGRSYATHAAPSGSMPEGKATQYPEHRSPFTTFRVLIELAAP